MARRDARGAKGNRKNTKRRNPKSEKGPISFRSCGFRFSICSLAKVTRFRVRCRHVAEETGWTCCLGRPRGAGAAPAYEAEPGRAGGGAGHAPADGQRVGDG